MPKAGDDGTSMRLRVPALLVNIAQFSNIKGLTRNGPARGELRPSSKKRQGVMAIHAALRGTVMKPAWSFGWRSRWSILLTSEKLNEGESHTHNAFRSSGTSPNFLISLCDEFNLRSER
jgi:hypothetical protein